MVRVTMLRWGTIVVLSRLRHPLSSVCQSVENSRRQKWKLFLIIRMTMIAVPLDDLLHPGHVVHVQLKREIEKEETKKREKFCYGEPAWVDLVVHTMMMKAMEEQQQVTRGGLAVRLRLVLPSVAVHLLHEAAEIERKEEVQAVVVIPAVVAVVAVERTETGRVSKEGDQEEEEEEEAFRQVKGVEDTGATIVVEAKEDEIVAVVVMPRLHIPLI